MKHSFVVLMILAVFGCTPKDKVPITIELHNDWYFKNVNDSVYLKATVPGNVHSDLLDHKLIADPFVESNEEHLQWISSENWEYKTAFSVDKNTLKKKHIALNFEGIDTYASVYLNDSLILQSNNAFREFNVDVKEILDDENELKIIFESTSVSENKEKEKLGYTLPEGNRVFTRKAQFQYGWDWGPNLNASGIWKPIRLIAWNDFRIKELDIDQPILSDSIAEVNFQIFFNNHSKERLNLEVYVNDSLYSNRVFQKESALKENYFQIKNPKLWWPHNLGDPYLYHLNVVVKDGKTVLDSVHHKIGLRTINLVTEKDSLGESFYFEVNEVPVYAKGANYIPQNSFQNKVTDSHYESLLEDAVNANMNMLRVWGGGIYENDIFYDLCDEKGILVWQDFMFACAMYPGDNAFLNNVAVEAEQQVKRLRNHPSIALWCGNNENSEGWHRWGWQANRSEKEKEEIWGNYLKVFDSILPNTVKKHSNIDYWESSPKYGRGNPKYKYEGDAHDWWIWHDAYPFEHLEENVPRFMSEFGFQSFPSYEAIKFINQSDSIYIDSNGFKNHQKHNRGFQLIEDYMKRDFPVPKNADDYVYMSQLLQAHGITKGLEAQRRAKPYNMGTLYWQLNDCWPAVSWSSIDFFGNWKALHYKTKRSFKNLLISSYIEDEILKTYIVNDDLKRYSGLLELKLLDFMGTEIWSDSIDIEIEKNSSSVKNEFDLNSVKFNKDEVFLIASFNDSQSYHYFVAPKDLKLQKEPIQSTITKTQDGFEIELSSKTLQKDLFLFCNDKGHFSDNYIDLLPNVKRTILFLTDAKSLESLDFKTFNSFIR